MTPPRTLILRRTDRTLHLHREARTLQLNTRGPQGPPGSSVIRKGVAVPMTSIGSTPLYTAVGRTVVTGLVIRLATVTSFVSVPTIRAYRRSDSAPYGSAATLFALNQVGEAFRLSLLGVLPVLEAGDTIDLQVQTAAGAASFATLVDIEGYVVT